MAILLGVCAVIVTVTFVALAVAAIRALNRFGEVAVQLEQTTKRLDESIVGVKDVTHEAHELLTSAGDVVPQVRGVVQRFAQVGDRAADLSHTFLDEVEAPVRTAARLFRGVRFTAGSLLERLARKEHAGVHNGGYDHE
jgi:uncharacterized protein YoxC